MRIRLNENIARIGCRQTSRASAIGVDRQVLKKRIPAAQLQLASQERALATGVHHETRLGDPVRAIGCVTHPHRPTICPQNVHHLMALSDVHTMHPAVLQEELVEEGTPDLVGVWVLVIRFTEIPTPGRFICAPDHGGAPFL